MTAHTHDYPFSQTLAMAQRVVNIVSSFSEERLKNWGETYPDSIDATINECGYHLLTHPEYESASAEEKQIANDIFKKQLEMVGKYADSLLIGDFIKEFSMQGNAKLLTLLIETLSDKGEMLVGPQTLGNAIRSVFYETQLGCEEKQKAAVVDMCKIMENLANHPHADITHLVDPYMLGITMVDASTFGQLDMVKVILNNLSDDALVIIGAKKIGQVIEGIFHAPSYTTKATHEESVTLIREFMKKLVDHPYMYITNLIDVNKLHDVVKAAYANSNIEIINAITENLGNKLGTFGKASNEGRKSQDIDSRFKAKKLKAGNIEDIRTLKVFLMRERFPHKGYGLTVNA